MSLKHPLYGAVDYVKELNTAEDYWFGLESMGRLLENVKNNPLDERFRRFSVDDPFFNSKIGCLIGSEKLMLSAGFFIDDVNGKEFYYMHATAEAWEELLTVSAIVQNILKERTKTDRKAPERMASKGRSVERVPSRDMTIETMALSRSNSKRSLPRSNSIRSNKAVAPRNSSSHSGYQSGYQSGDSLPPGLRSPLSVRSRNSKNSAENRRSSLGNSTLNDSANSFFMDEGDDGMTSGSCADNERPSSPKKKKKKKKKKKSTLPSSATDRAHEEIIKSGGKMSKETGKHHVSEESSGAEAKSKKKRPSLPDNKRIGSGDKAMLKKSGKHGSASSISSASSFDEKRNRSKRSMAGPGVQMSETVGPVKTATKDFWKNASTQALVASRVQNESASKGNKNWGLLKNVTKVTVGLRHQKSLHDLEIESYSADEGAPPGKASFRRKMSTRTESKRLGSDDEGDLGDTTDEDNEGPSRRTRRGGTRIKIDAMHKLTDASRRGLTDKTVSSRSMDSSNHRSRSSSKHQRRMERAESRRSTSMSMKDLERGLSEREIDDLRKMTEEKKELREMRKKRLLDQIKRERGPRWSVLMMSVSIVTAAELGLDLGTTLVSFKSLVRDFKCCGHVIEADGLTLGLTMPYLFLILVEMVLLALSVRHAKANSAWDAERLRRVEDEDDELDFYFFDDDDSSFDSNSYEFEEEIQFHCSKLISWVLICNPFLGCIITWVLLYDVSSKNEAFSILALETGSCVLMFVSVYLERAKLDFVSLLIHGIPLIPFAATCFVVWYYLEKGGICFRDGNFWFGGCGLCAAEIPSPPHDGLCPNGTMPYQGTYCGDTVEEQFCYYSY